MTSGSDGLPTAGAGFDDVVAALGEVRAELEQVRKLPAVVKKVEQVEREEHWTRRWLVALALAVALAAAGVTWWNHTQDIDAARLENAQTARIDTLARQNTVLIARNAQLEKQLCAALNVKTSHAAAAWRAQAMLDATLGSAGRAAATAIRGQLSRIGGAEECQS
jgi:hypothetical protein